MSEPLKQTDDLLARLIARQKANRAREKLNDMAKNAADIAALPEDQPQDVMVGNQNGVVLIAYAAPIEWMGLTPDEAEAFGHQVISHAKAARLYKPPEAEAGPSLDTPTGDSP